MNSITLKMSAVFKKTCDLMPSFSPKHHDRCKEEKDSRTIDSLKNPQNIVGGGAPSQGPLALLPEIYQFHLSRMSSVG